MKSYVFSVVLEPDEDVWCAYVPELEAKGAATWGHTKEEALENIKDVARMVIEELLEDGETLPPSVTVSDRPVVAVTVRSLTIRGSGPSPLADSLLPCRRAVSF